MKLGEAACLGRLRLREGLEVCAQGDSLWLRVLDVSEVLDMELRTLPGARFTLLPDQQLVPFGCQVPEGYLPDGSWTPLSQWMAVEVGLAALPGVVRDRVPLRLVRGGPPSDANVIVTTADQWHAYATGAPQVRLDRWAFAVSEDGQAVIWGAPSPPIQGVRFVEEQGVAVEAGWTWAPPVDRRVLAEVLELAKRDLALIHADGSWERIRGEDFVRATRSAVRLSQEASVDG